MSPLNKALAEKNPAERVCMLVDYLHEILRECRPGFYPSQAQIDQANWEIGKAMDRWRGASAQKESNPARSMRRSASGAEILATNSMVITREKVGAP